MKEKLIFNDGSSLVIEQGSSISNIIVSCDTKEDFVNAWDLFTISNLSHIKIISGSEEVVAEYYDLIFNGVSATEKDVIIANFSLREETEMEKLTKELAKMKATQEVQDGAIMDLGEGLNLLQVANEVQDGAIEDIATIVSEIVEPTEEE